MDIYGDVFVTGSSDKLIKVWKYNEGAVTHIGNIVYNYRRNFKFLYLIGRGHSGEINRVMIASDGKHLVSVSADGAIIRWKMPPIADIDIVSGVDQQMKNVVVGDVDSAKCEEESSQNDGDDDDKEDGNKDENAEEGGGEEKEQKEQEVKEEEQIKKSTPTTGACE